MSTPAVLRTHQLKYYKDPLNTRDICSFSFLLKNGEKPFPIETTSWTIVESTEPKVNIKVIIGLCDVPCQNVGMFDCLRMRTGLHCEIKWVEIVEEIVNCIKFIVKSDLVIHVVYKLNIFLFMKFLYLRNYITSFYIGRYIVIIDLRTPCFLLIVSENLIEGVCSFLFTTLCSQLSLFFC